MSYRDQKRFFEILPRYERKFDKNELEDYKMLKTRHRDEEELDRLSLGRLKTLFEKYHLNRVKPNYDHLFKKKETDGE